MRRFWLYLSRGHSLSGDEEFGVDVVEVPLEGLAFEAVSQLPPGADVAKVAEVEADALVVVLLEVVEPDLGEADGVPPQDVDAAPPLVGGAFPEDKDGRPSENFFAPLDYDNFYIKRPFNSGLS